MEIKPLTNFELIQAAKNLRIPNFLGVFLRDTLPKNPRKKENGILNLDDSKGPGTHWVAWHKDGRKKIYFDSYGIQPPKELVRYLKSPISYNTDQVQDRNTVICGHLCLFVLKELGKGEDFQDIINELLS